MPRRWRQAAGRDASCSLIGGEGTIGKVIGEQREQRAPQEGGFARAEGLRLRVEGAGASASAILASGGVTAPVMAALHAGPAALEEGALCVGVCAMGWRWTVVTDFVASDRRALHFSSAAHHDQSAGAREARRERPSGKAGKRGRLGCRPAWPESAAKKRRAGLSVGRLRRREPRWLATATWPALLPSVGQAPG